MERYFIIKNYIERDVLNKIDSLENIRTKEFNNLKELSESTQQFNKISVNLFTELYDLFNLGYNQKDFVKVSTNASDISLDKDSILRRYYSHSTEENIYYYKFELTIFDFISEFSKKAVQEITKTHEYLNTYLNEFKLQIDKEELMKKEIEVDSDKYFLRIIIHELMVNNFVEKIEKLYQHYDIRSLFEKEQNVEEVEKIRNSGKLTKNDKIISILQDDLYFNNYHNQLNKYNHIY